LKDRLVLTFVIHNATDCIVHVFRKCLLAVMLFEAMASGISVVFEVSLSWKCTVLQLQPNRRKLGH